jgi:hypothetical protein
MFQEYPKSRIELPQAFQDIYKEYHQRNRQGKTFASAFSQLMESWMHRKVASDVKDNAGRSTLEIGAGTLNQLRYENSRPYDIVEPFSELYDNSPYRDRIRKIYSDIDQIEGTKKYERIISIATFEHITDLPKIVARTCTLLIDPGTLRIAIPNEGTFLWKMGWKLTTGLEFRIRRGLDYGILMRYEHVNTADEIEKVINYFYRNTRCSCLGTGKKIALYRFYECREPEIERAQAYLNETEGKHL